MGAQISARDMAVLVSPPNARQALIDHTSKLHLNVVGERKERGMRRAAETDFQIGSERRNPDLLQTRGHVG